jgi:hypothetical protein
MFRLEEFSSFAARKIDGGWELRAPENDPREPAIRVIAVIREPQPKPAEVILLKDRRKGR